jgi:hypothetical protein
MRREWREACKEERTEYYDRDIDGTQDAKFVCLFEEAGFALSEGVREGGPRKDETKSKYGITYK